MPEWLEHIDDLVPRLPLFVAAPLREVGEDLRAGRARPALFSICEATEGLVRFLVVAVGSEVVARHGGVAPDWFGQAAASTLERPTFGALVRLLDAIVGDCAAYDAGLQALAELPVAWPVMRGELFADRDGDGAPELTSLVALRNPLAHGMGVGDEYAKELLTHWGPRLADTLYGLPWLTELEVWAREPGAGPLLLRGCEPITASAPGAEIAALAPGEVALRRADKPVPLVPLAYYRGIGEGTSAVGQLFMRMGTVGLLYGLFGPADALQVEGSAEERARFEAMFDLARWRRAADERGFQERGHEAEFEADARGFVARADALDTLWRAIVDRPQGVLGVLGPAGIGKSSLVARAAIDLRDELAEREQWGQSRELLLAYRFIDRDRGCAPLPFLRWLIERLARATDKETRIKPHASVENLRDQALGLASSAPQDRIVLVLDGVDELARREARFVAELLPRLARVDKLLVLASSRPEGGVPEALAAAGALLPWPGGLPGMTPAELRAMLVALVPGLARRLVSNETFDETARNAFMDRLVERSDGLPLYVALAVQVTHEAGFHPSQLDDPSWLPRRVEGFFRRLAETGALSDRRRAGPLIGCILALAHEPMSAIELGALYTRATSGEVRRQRRGNEEQAQLRHGNLSAGVLTDLAGLLRRAEGEDGTARFRLLHDDLRAFVRQSPELRSTLEEARDVLADAALNPGKDAVTHYLYRHGAKHLIEAWPDDPKSGAKEAADLLADFSYQQRRLERLATSGGDAGIRDDWVRVADMAIIEDPIAKAWHHFWSTEGSRFLPGEGRSGAIEFISTTLDFSPDSYVGQAAEQTYREGALPIEGTLVAREGSRVLTPSDVLVELTGHESYLKGALELSDRRILAWGSDGLLIWRSDGRREGDLMDHGGQGVAGACELTDHRILSWTERDQFDEVTENRFGYGSIGLWKSDGRPDRKLIQPVGGRVRGARELADRRILSWSDFGVLEFWLPDGQSDGGPIEGHDRPLGGLTFLRNGKILSWDTRGLLDEFSTVFLRSPNGELLQTYRVGGSEIQDICVLSNGNILFWTKFGRSLRYWNTDCGGEADEWPTQEGKIEGACELSDSRILSWGSDGTLQFWLADGRPDCDRMNGHNGRVLGARELSDGRVVSWGDDGFLRFWFSDGQPDGVPMKVHGSRVDGAIELSGRRVLTWGKSLRVARHSDTLRIWCISSKGGKELKGAQQADVSGAYALSDGRTVTWSDDGRFRFWREDGSPDGPWKKMHESRIRCTCEFSHGLILSWDHDGMLMLWRSEDIPSSVKQDEVAGFCKLTDDSGIFIWNSKGRCLLWRPSLSRASDRVKVVQEEGVEGAIDLHDRRILTWSRGGKLRFRGADGQPDSRTLDGHKGGVRGALELSDHRVLSWGKEKGLRLWSRDGHSLGPSFGGHNGTSQALELSDGSLLTSDHGRELMIWAADGQSGGETLQGPWSGGAYSIRELASGDILAWGVVGIPCICWRKYWPRWTALLDHTGSPLGACELPDGRLVTWSDGTPGWGGMLHLWSPLGDLQQKMPVKGSVLRAAVADDQVVAITSSFQGRLYIHDWHIPRA